MKIKKIHLGFLISVLLVVGAGLLYPRGGGGNPDFRGDLIYGNFLPAILKPAAIPETCTQDIVLNPLKEPQSVVQLSSACVVNFPGNLQVTPYCVNKATNWGGANITVPSMDLIHYKSIPKNCYILVNDETLHSRTLVCSGAAGSTVKLTVENSCIPPAANLPDVEPSCPEGYSRSPEDLGCSYTLLETDAFCGEDSFYDRVNDCCRSTKYYPPDTSACPEGYQALWSYSEKDGSGTATFDKVVCTPKTKGAITTGTRDYTVTLGTCSQKRETDAHAPACVPDPAGGCQ